MTTMIQDKNGVIAATPSTMPSDRHFRNAWVFDSAQAAITEDITAAKVIFKDKIREVRTPLLEAEDVAFMKALEVADSDARVASQTKKISLRNAPQASAISSADTIDKLKAAWDESLLGTSPYK
tara:strand:- start:9185 stop:9556 length:372 start_codon:yes stop_codon:yes gene_type:complete